MPVNINQAPADHYVEVELSGKLTKEDYATFVPEMESAIKEHGKVHMMVVMRDFHGWTMGAMWEDTKFDWKHFSDIEKLALVGDKKWEEGMATFCKPFTRAKIKYFDIAEIDAARNWIGAA
jgi:ABC-type antimicrobial peptide transport system ATPase subunit